MSFDLQRLLDDARGHQFERFESHVNPQWARVLRTIGFNRTWVRGEGPYLFDAEGTRYLDFMSGWGVFNFGRSHPTIKAAMSQAVASDFPGWIAFDAPVLAGELARELLRRMPNGLDRAYFCNSGAECAEAALKFARAATGKAGVIYLKKAFHGLTTGALAVNGDPSFREGFDPLRPGAIEVPINDIEALERAFATGEIGAFMAEPIQGKGVNICSDEYLLRAQELCREHGALLVMDEVQTGMGRTGRFCAFEWVPGLDPDVVLLAKALSGGYVPVGAVLTRRAIYDAVYPSMSKAIVHACTFGMGNLAMVAGLASLQVLDEERLMERALRLGARFAKGLEALKPRFQFLSQIRQRGLMIGIEFDRPKAIHLQAAWSMVHKMDKNLFPQAIVIPLFDDHKILTQVAGHEIDVVKLLPPLIIDESDVDWFVQSFEEVMTRLHRFPGPAWEVLKKLGKHALTARAKERAHQTL